ncbi:site-2 protease family protein [candidate division KSB1 bacterium]|nr:site-2 protease family protein [candidate division KSB1 bacterium]RQW07125.1 MAG: site-2 protease family protein [candidate division KSB1 bacterium]
MKNTYEEDTRFTIQEEYPDLQQLHSMPQRRRVFRFRALPANKPLINVILFLLTIASTWLTLGVWYSLPVIAILLAHEMGHYLMCRRYHIPATLPFFIPFPYLNPFGTMGAMIQMRGLIPHRKALFDVGAAGPLAGLIVTIPVIYFGLQLSDIVPASDGSEGMTIILGESLVYKLLSFLALGSIPVSYDVRLHDMAYAGWVGLFVTSLNLLPIGQLDGGHIFYSLYGRKGFKFMPLFILALGGLTVIYYGWALLFVLLLLLGRKHPPPLDDTTPLDPGRKILGYIMFIIFVTCFSPTPFKF